MRRVKRAKRIPEWFIAFVGYVILFSALWFQSWELYKAQICNKAFVLYFKHNYGINVNLDLLYKDAVKWVNDPQYQ